MAKAIMVQGTMSNAGKSLLELAFAEFLSRTGTVWHLLSPRIWR